MPARTLRLVEDESVALDRGPVKGGRMKIAFTTNDMKSVNAHFAGARTIAVWEVGQDDATFLKAVQFDNASSEGGKHDDDGDSRIEARLAALDGCAILFVKAIGGPAAAKVVRRDVHPVKLPAEEAIADVIVRVQAMMQAPPPWLRKAMLAGQAGNLDFLEDDEA
ncbi:nitrogen fixation protein NifX [Novispirillum sp. DQ9]|uniref:nitrogen fixation protein NifX n=1 Tax=Novispirillum sp. DQ9 TaxID=3398612 RepID=UPI003C7A5EB5